MSRPVFGRRGLMAVRPARVGSGPPPKAAQVLPAVTAGVAFERHKPMDERRKPIAYFFTAGGGPRCCFRCRRGHLHWASPLLSSEGGACSVCCCSRRSLCDEQKPIGTKRLATYFICIAEVRGPPLRASSAKTTCALLQRTVLRDKDQKLASKFKFTDSGRSPLFFFLLNTHGAQYT
jgi:hypothetical protein